MDGEFKRFLWLVKGDFAGEVLWAILRGFVFSFQPSAISEKI